MIICEVENLSIATIEEDDRKKVIELFSSNDFNCDYETGALRPSKSQLNKIIDDIINKKTDENSILVLKVNGIVVGYISLFVEFDNLNIGHIAVESSERGKGYGSLLVQAAISIAENDGRDVSLFCNHNNNIFKKLGFETPDGIHYYHQNQGQKDPTLPKIFVSVDEYKKRAAEENQKEIERFKKFLESMKDF